MDRALDLNDGGDMGLPLRIGHGRRRVEHADDPCFGTIAIFVVDRSHAREEHGLAAMSLDAPAQGRLVFLQLNDQMRVRAPRSLEGFFWQCCGASIWMRERRQSKWLCSGRDVMMIVARRQ